MVQKTRKQLTPGFLNQPEIYANPFTTQSAFTSITGL